MNGQQLGESIQDRFGPDVIGWNVLGSDQLYVTITPDSLVEVAEYLYQDQGCRYVINGGTDAVAMSSTVGLTGVSTTMRFSSLISSRRMKKRSILPSTLR